jgi:hypothetical protein
MIRARAAAFLAAALFLAASGPVCANDSTAELASGGLVLMKNPSIAMRSERLEISAREIRVRYIFFNNSDRDIATTVAFPMPDIAIEGPDANIAIPTDNPENILNFSTTVDGRKVVPRVEQKVFAKRADQTETLRRLGLPLALHLRATADAFDRLPPAEWQKLLDLGLAEIEDYDVGKGMQKHLSPRGSLKTVYYWDQNFPAHRETIVEHRYSPSVGQSAGTSLGNLEGERIAEYRRKYCVEDSFLAAVNQARQAAQMEHGAPFIEERTVYILSTGANWAARLAISPWLPIRAHRTTSSASAPRGSRKSDRPASRSARRISCRSATYRS